LETPRENHFNIKGGRVLKYALFSLVFLMLTVVVFFGVQWFSDSVTSFFIFKLNGNDQSASPADLSGAVELAQARQTAQAPPYELPLRDWRVGEVSVSAPSAISVEVGTDGPKTLYHKNEQEKLPIASLTKLMTALVVLERYDLSQKVVIDQTAMDQEGEQGSLALGQTLTVKNLLYIMLIESSNRAAYALSEVAGHDQFVALMNGRAAQMGLASTHFTDSSGLDAGSYSTVEDLVKLSDYLFERYPLFRDIVGTASYNLYLDDGTFHHALVSTNKLLGQNGIIGGKTGYTESAKQCMMVVQQGKLPGTYLISIVLGSDDRFADITSITDWLNHAYAWQ
jgi:D-alanyl-D-alanine carboxypeptidase